jgi:hypothetical protein
MPALFFDGVLRIKIRESTFYACGYCGLIYEDKETATRCAEFCRKHGGCSIEIEELSIGRIEPASFRLTKTI